MTSAVSSKTSYLVVGEEAGPSKIAKAQSLGTSVLDEDQFFALVRSFEGQEIAPPASPVKKAAAKKIKISVKPEAAQAERMEEPIVPLKPSFNRPDVPRPISE